MDRFSVEQNASSFGNLYLIRDHYHIAESIHQYYHCDGRILIFPDHDDALSYAAVLNEICVDFQSTDQSRILLLYFHCFDDFGRPVYRNGDSFFIDVRPSPEQFPSIFIIKGKYERGVAVPETPLMLLDEYSEKEILFCNGRKFKEDFL